MLLTSILLALAPGCSGKDADSGTLDSSATDGGSTDGGTTDGGGTDGGTTDGGSTDGGTTDGGSTGGSTGPVGELTPAIILDGPRPTNVLVISVDTLRTDHFNYFGYTERVTTPTMDTFLRDGLLFNNHYSCSSWTFPSVLCALTGMDQVTMGFWPNNSTTGGGPGVAPDELRMMAEYFDDQGYRTMLSSGSGFLGGAESNSSQGFDVGSGAFDIPAETLVNNALGYLSDHLAENPDVPWMMHVHFLEPHAPYPVPEEYLVGLDELPPIENDLTTEEGVLSLWQSFPNLNEEAQEISMEHLKLYYDASIRYADDEIARLLREVEAMGAMEDTLIVFFVDHGEEFWEHGNFNHGYTAYEEVTRAPMAFYMPGNLRPYTLDALTTHEDLMPTLLTIMGWDIPEDLTGIAAGTGTRDWVYNLSYRDDKTIQAVTDGSEKLIYRWGETVSVGAGESKVVSGPETQKLFFELPADPQEKDNLYDPEDSRVLGWWDLLLPEVERLADQETAAAPENPGP